MGRSPGEGNGYPLKYSGLENSMDCIVQRVAKSQTQLSNFHFPRSLPTGGPMLHQAPLPQSSTEKGSLSTEGHMGAHSWALQSAGLCSNPTSDIYRPVDLRQVTYPLIAQWPCLQNGHSPHVHPLGRLSEMVHIKGLTRVPLWYRKGSQNISCFLKTRQPETCPHPSTQQLHGLTCEM